MLLRSRVSSFKELLRISAQPHRELSWGSVHGYGSNIEHVDQDWPELHRKKRFTSFPSPAGMSLTKLPLGRNNSVMTSLFPPRESLVVTSRLGTGNSRTFFLRCILSVSSMCTSISVIANKRVGAIFWLPFCLMWYTVKNDTEQRGRPKISLSPSTTGFSQLGKMTKESKQE